MVNPTRDGALCESHHNALTADGYSSNELTDELEATIVKESAGADAESQDSSNPNSEKDAEHSVVQPYNQVTSDERTEQYPHPPAIRARAW